MRTRMTFRVRVWTVWIRMLSQRQSPGKMAIKVLVMCLLLTQVATGSSTAHLPDIKPNYPPGTLAKDRLRPKCVSILTEATRVEVQRKRWARDTDSVSEGDGFITLSRESDKDALFAAKVASLLFEDAPYLSDPNSGVSNDPVYFLRFWRGEDQVKLEIVPNRHLFRVSFQDKPGPFWLYA